MSKIISSLLLVLIVLAPISFVSASDLSGKTTKEIYASPEELLVDMINPYITEIVSEECGEGVHWTFERVNKLELIVDHTGSESKSWYELNLMIRTFSSTSDNEDMSLDTVTLHIDPKTYFGSIEGKRKNLDEVSVKVVNYSHHHDNEKE
ncbi:DUF3888 domain-containing protein [Halalkalibacter krulwichiae]|uniref:DUF3888 domain-containing protein n=1 Tax=Halalkalibacter krulwichiae TaxID=199441 RepID=A0A1X9MD43_9BACI|nr:DUF3888 domain-containing protein [Halalkalibacter krulwichiae]ARK31357.1 hypothetical protein BkAM31D_16685 [Halalkalibacter krulwichiae]